MEFIINSNTPTQHSMNRIIYLIVLVALVLSLSTSHTLFSQAPNESGAVSWTQADIGHLKIRGSSQQLDSIYEVAGSGGDLFGTEDGLHFMHRPWSGDGILVGKVISIHGSDGGGKAGLMFRAGTGPGAANVFFSLTSFNRIVFQRRTQVNEQSDRDSFITVPTSGGEQQMAKSGRTRVWSENATGSTNTVSSLRWLALARRGDNFSAFCSSDGSNWQWIATERIPMPHELQIGLAVTSFKENALCIAQFDQVTAQPPTPVASIQIGTGQGLSGIFKDETNAIRRISPTINFDWNYQNRRLPGINHTNFSAVWEGYLEAQYSEPYAFQLVNDDCARLWISGQLLIDNCEKSELRQARAVALLESGKKYAVRIEYQQKKGPASIKLLWSSPSTAKEVVPKTQLYIADDVANASDERNASTRDDLHVLPNPWSSYVLGTTTNNHALDARNESFLVASGGGIAGRVLDEGRFIYQKWQGDVEIHARVIDQESKSESSRFGIMIRENLKEESAIAMLETDPKNRARLYHRKNLERGSYLGPFGAGRSWIKLVRRGDSFTAYASKDGAQWIWQGSVSVPMASETYVGFVIGSNDPDEVYQAVFDNVRVTVPSLITPTVGKGDGLGAVYLDRTTGNRVERVDSEVNFIWSRRSPLEGISRTNFTVRWEGLMEAQYSEVYRIHVLSNQRIRLWLDGKLVFAGLRGPADIERRIKIPLIAGKRYALRLEYENPQGAAEIRLLWSSPNTPKQPIPQTQLYSPFTTEYAELGDKDHDGLSDEWELLYGLNPFDTSDAIQDSDQDGLSNLEEQRAGTNPNNSDSDGDGFTDGMEVKELGTNPFIRDISRIQTIAEVKAANAVGRAGIWSQQGEAIYSLDGRGWVEYVLNTEQPNMFRLEIEGNSHNPNDRKREFDLLVWLDGEFLGRIVLLASNQTSVVHQLTPWLKAGNHRVRIVWDNAIRNRSIQLSAIRLQELQGSDLDNNQITDWIDRRLKLWCSVTVAPQLSAVSPVCIEGRGEFLSMMTISGGVIPQPGVNRCWYANVPLVPQAKSTVICSFQNDGFQTTNEIIWKPTNLLEADNLTIREGAALLLTAVPIGADKGQMQIAVTGVTNYVGPIDQPVVHRFNQAGSFQVVGTYLSETGLSETKTISVRVVSASLGPNPAIWINKSRAWKCSLPTGLTLQTDTNLQMKRTVKNGENLQYAMSTEEARKWQILARIGTNGPIVARTTAEGFCLSGAYETGAYDIQHYPDGSILVEMGLILSPVLPQAKVRLELHVGGVIFEDGTTVKDLSSADFDELGRATVRFIKIRNSKTSVCHQVQAYQGPVYLGAYP